MSCINPSSDFYIFSSLRLGILTLLIDPKFSGATNTIDLSSFMYTNRVRGARVIGELVLRNR